MAESTPIAPIRRSFLTEAPAASVNVGLALISRRSDAIADFWRSYSEVREPSDLVAVQLHYWTQLVDDYQDAFAEGLSKVAGAAQPASGQVVALA